MMLACLGKQEEAVITSPDALVPSLGDAAWAGVGSRVLGKIISTRLTFKV